MDENGSHMFGDKVYGESPIARMGIPQNDTVTAPRGRVQEYIDFALMEPDSVVDIKEMFASLSKADKDVLGMFAMNTLNCYRTFNA